MDGEDLWEGTVTIPLFKPSAISQFHSDTGNCSSEQMKHHFPSAKDGLILDSSSLLSRSHFSR